jgi:hypothetical protein
MDQGVYQEYLGPPVGPLITGTPLYRPGHAAGNFSKAMALPHALTDRKTCLVAFHKPRPWTLGRSCHAGDLTGGRGGEMA